MHKFLIPNLYYVPHGGVCLLSPQHWVQTRRDTKPRQGTGETTDAEKCVLFWEQWRYTWTLFLDKRRSNVANLHLTPGYKLFDAFCTEAGIDDDHVYDSDPVLASPAEVSDDEESVSLDVKMDVSNDDEGDNKWRTE